MRKYAHIAVYFMVLKAGIGFKENHPLKAAVATPVILINQAITSFKYSASVIRASGPRYHSIQVPGSR